MDGWGTSPGKMSQITGAEMNEHVVKSGKRFANKDQHSILTNLVKAKTIIDIYQEEIEFLYNDKLLSTFEQNAAIVLERTTLRTN